MSKDTKGSNAFPEIKTEYDYYMARFEGREIKLLYRIVQYSLVPSHKVDNYRRNGVKLKRFGDKQDDGTVNIRYYQPYSYKQISLDTKRWLINKILSTPIEGYNITLRDKIEKQWYERNAHKTKAARLMDEEAILLDVLANYYLGGVEGEGVLTMDMSRTIKNREIVTIAGMINTDEENNVTEFSPQARNKWEFRKMSREKKKNIDKNIPKRWRNSRTYKMNNLYSVIEPKNVKVKNWKTGEDMESNSEYRYDIHRLINPNDEYSADWCLVNTKNEFAGSKGVYKIDEAVEAYKKDINDRYEMDTILVLEQYGKTYYYDESIDKIPNKMITKLS